MSAREYTSPPTITIDGVRLEAPTMKWSHTSAVDTVARRFGTERSEPVRVEFTIADSGDAFAAITRMIDAANREVSRAILGGVPSESGVLYPDGSRGCFHEGCDGTGSAEEGGSHWCRWATCSRRARASRRGSGPAG